MQDHFHQQPDCNCQIMPFDAAQDVIVKCGSNPIDKGILIKQILIILVLVCIILLEISPHSSPNHKLFTAMGTVININQKLGYIILDQDGKKQIFLFKKMGDTPNNLLRLGGQKVTLRYQKKFDHNIIFHFDVVKTAKP